MLNVIHIGIMISIERDRMTLQKPIFKIFKKNK